MKPKDLKYPFPWEDRKPLLLNQIFFIPDHYALHGEQKIDLPSFNQNTKIMIEYCSGNGSWVTQKALENPESSWIAVERQFERVQKIYAKVHNLGLKNLLVVCGEAKIFTHFYLSGDLIDEAYINFPDPWPKSKHAKHRLMQLEFIEELSRIIKPKGMLMVVTDDANYVEEILEKMGKNENWACRYEYPHFRTSQENYGSSYFDTLWRSKGKTIHYLKFQNEK
ncbi:MAG: tRNA (guanosine(46)-N7)-methyltransferase TrmB [Chlamydiae bacterium]|nr:tRNA (guanosine(46)-N7)-methyltransferase TrmB [Chlamydiota bacterium]